MSAIEKNQQGILLAAQYFKDEDALAVGRLFVKNNTWITPTMVQSLPGHFDKTALMGSDTWNYMPASIVSAWMGRLKNEKQLMRGDDPGFAQLELRTVAAFHKAGVKLLAGTDANDAFVGSVPGFSLHQEMQLFVKAGLSNLEALQTATLNPAIYMEAADSLGTIEKNKLADIVILDADPLVDISNATKIHGVILNGRYLRRERLNEILNGVRLLVKTQ